MPDARLRCLSKTTVGYHPTFGGTPVTAIHRLVVSLTHRFAHSPGPLPAPPASQPRLSNSMFPPPFPSAIVYPENR